MHATLVVNSASPKSVSTCYSRSIQEVMQNLIVVVEAFQNIHTWPSMGKAHSECGVAQCSEKGVGTQVVGQVVDHGESQAHTGRITQQTQRYLEPHVKG